MALDQPAALDPVVQTYLDYLHHLLKDQTKLDFEQIQAALNLLASTEIKAHYAMVKASLGQEAATEFLRDRVRSDFRDGTDVRRARFEALFDLAREDGII